MVEAIWDHVAMMADELPFIAGDAITVLDSTSNFRLWYGVCKDSRGWFPSSYVRVFFKIHLIFNFFLFNIKNNLKQLILMIGRKLFLCFN